MILKMILKQLHTKLTIQCQTDYFLDFTLEYNFPKQISEPCIH